MTPDCPPAGSPVEVLPALGVLLMVSLLVSCAQFEAKELVPSFTLSQEELNLAVSPSNSPGEGVDFGFTSSVNESDSLTNVAVLPGVRIRSVISSGAADIGGIRAGDVVLSIDDTATNHPDVVARIAQQSASEKSFIFRFRRDTAVLETTVVAGPVNDQRLAPKELYRVDPIASRAGYKTEVLLLPDQKSVIAARIVEMFPKSPLPVHDFQLGDNIIAVNGAAVQSAQHLVNMFVNDYGLGADVSVTMVRNNELEVRSLQLWDPGRRLSRFSLMPLLNYESSLAPDRTKFSIFDFWLFSLFSYDRVDGEKKVSLFSLWHFQSGLGELAEVPPQ